MKQTLSLSRILPLALAFSLLAAAQSQAAVVITNLQLTTTSISFDISGTMPTAVPADSPGFIFITNPSLSASPGFALNANFTPATSGSFSGTQTLMESREAFLGESSFGDYMAIGFDSELTANEAIMGTFTAAWATPQINPAAVTSLNFYWGASASNTPPNNGTLLGNFAVGAVPEPTGAALLLTGLAIAAGRRRRQ
jgi:hypothetical protein